MHKSITRINKAAIIIIHHPGINFLTLPKIRQGGVFIHDENQLTYKLKLN
jgi:hypothetical protein